MRRTLSKSLLMHLKVRFPITLGHFSQLRTQLYTIKRHFFFRAFSTCFFPNNTMPFRCKCGRTFEKVESFGAHTSGCAPFHHRRVSTSDILLSSNQTPKKNHKKALSIQTTQDYFNSNPPQRRLSLLLSPILGLNGPSSSTSSPLIETPTAPPPTSSSTPIFESSRFMMPTALSIQNTFEGVRKRRSMSYSTTQQQPFQDEMPFCT
jgi:hypothetical protein